jgi:tRNA-dihydrouridine synthase B
MISPDSASFAFNVVSAPLAGITDPPYQKILHRLSCPFIYSEMVSAHGLVRSPKTVHRMLDSTDMIHPIGTQIFGSDPRIMADAAMILESSGVDTIDINMGCPVKKVIKGGSGLALMRTPQVSREIMDAVRKAVRVPVSAKFRLGWDPSSRNVELFARMAEDAGYDFITVHARYRSTYEPPAIWEEIRTVKSNVSIPVIGNGDVMSPADAKRMIELTGCDAVMVGRGILGQPWLPSQIHQYLTDGILQEEISLDERVRIFLNHLDLLVDFYGHRIASLIFRKHAAWYLKGLPLNNHLRSQIFSITRPDDYRRLIEAYRDGEFSAGWRFEVSG